MELLANKAISNMTSNLVELVFAHGSVEGVMNAIVGGRQVKEKKRNGEALYHLKKMIGHQYEEQKHIDELKKLGISFPDTHNCFFIGSGIEKFGVELSGNSFELCGKYFFQVSKEALDRAKRMWEKFEEFNQQE